MIAPMLDGGGGTYDWKEVRAEFIAPAEATTASLGTVLRETGTAWFDDVSLVCLSPPGSPPPEDASSVWPVNPLVKVFREDLPPERIPPAAISCARNEKEPLQLAVRSAELRPRATQPVWVTFSVPKDARAGAEALEAAAALVSSPCEIGRYSTRILPDPDQVPAVRGTLARAIESLGDPDEAGQKCFRREGSSLSLEG